MVEMAEAAFVEEAGAGSSSAEVVLSFSQAAVCA